MDESAWIGLREPWDRLRWARIRWQTANGGATTARAGAESVGLAENTYSAYERPVTSSKHTDLTHDRAIEFGRKFRVNWVWLLTGDETPFDRTVAQQRILQAMTVLPEKEQEQVARAIEGLISGMRQVA